MLCFWLDFVELSSLSLFKFRSQSTGNSAQILKKLLYSISGEVKHENLVYVKLRSHTCQGSF